MIENFEHYSVPMSDDLKPIAIWLNDYFAGKTKFSKPTQQKPIKADTLIKAIKDIFSHGSFNGVMLRTCVNHLRQTGSVPVLSNSKGYYTSDSNETILSNIRSLEQRASGIQNAADGLRRFIK